MEWLTLLAVLTGLGLVMRALVEIPGALFSDWSELARRFPDAAPEARRPSVWTHMVIGNPGMDYFVRIGADDAGLHVAALPPFRFARRSFVVPWETVDRRGTSRFPFYWLPFWGMWVRYGIGYYTTIGLRRESKAERLVEEHLIALEAEANHRTIAGS